MHPTHFFLVDKNRAVYFLWSSTNVRYASGSITSGYFAVTCGVSLWTWGFDNRNRNFHLWRKSFFGSPLKGGLWSILRNDRTFWGQNVVPFLPILFKLCSTPFHSHKWQHHSLSSIHLPSSIRWLACWDKFCQYLLWTILY